MRYMISTIIVLIFTACTNNAAPTPKEQVTTEPIVMPAKTPIVHETNEVATNIEPMIIDESSIAEIPATSTNDTIAGEYKLYRGVISFGGIREVLTTGHLVIEQLDDDDFGYYYTTQVDSHSPNGYFGIFHLKDNKYSQKVIEDNGVAAQPIVSIVENIELVVEEPKLELKINASGKTDIIWERSFANESKNTTIENSLKQAREDYIKFYKEKFSKVTDI